MNKETLFALLCLDYLICYYRLSHAVSWMSEGGCKGTLIPLDFENLSKKGCFLSFEWETTNFTFLVGSMSLK